MRESSPIKYDVDSRNFRLAMLFFALAGTFPPKFPGG
jgi:hypothetical protein